MANRLEGRSQPDGEGVPPSAAVLLIGNLFLLVGLLLVDSNAVRIVLVFVAAAMLGSGILILSRHAARLKAIHEPVAEADERNANDRDADGDA